jgi:hypothetical protein
MSSPVSTTTNRDPIFIHSLFRAGSTYVFSKFRQRKEYWCYQEPLHEIALQARDDPTALTRDLGPEMVAYLRHPKLDESYFRELLSTWPAWRNALDQEAIYNAYFSSPRINNGTDYWRTLIEASKARPVIQECRTPGRIKCIKEALRGYHIYLWRNPRDQWWSYKTDAYFETANQIIIRAPGAPAPVHLQRIALELGGTPSGDPNQDFATYNRRPLPSQHKYSVFYMLWCLGMRAGIEHADLIISIDKLSGSPQYRADIENTLKNSANATINFDDCNVPASKFLEEDNTFFEPIETSVHAWLLDGGWSQAELEQIKSHKQSIPDRPDEYSTTERFGAYNQAQRARSIARNLEDALAKQFTEFSQQLQNSHRQAEELSKIATMAEAKATEAANLSSHATAQTARLKDQVADLEQRLAAETARATIAEQYARHITLQSEQDAQQIKAAEDQARTNELHEIQAIERANNAEYRANIAENSIMIEKKRAYKDVEEWREKEAACRTELKITKQEIKKINDAFLLLSDDNHRHYTQLQDIHKDNHRHFTQLQEARQQLELMLAESLNYRLLAEQRAHELSVLRRSLSWRVTAPFRRFLIPIVERLRSWRATPSIPPAPNKQPETTNRPQEQETAYLTSRAKQIHTELLSIIGKT